MLEDVTDGSAAATRLAGGAPLRSTLDVADPGDWLALDAGVREVAWYSPRPLPEWEESAPLPADLTGLIPFFAAPAACRWARQSVESTFTSQVIRPFASASAWSRVRIRAKVPSRCQRRNRS
ncbi:hypothetical protein [Streptomyces sp. E-15]